MKLKLKTILDRLLRSKAYRYFRIGLNILLMGFVMSLIVGESPLGRLSGWALFSVFLSLNIWGLWVHRKPLLQFWDYVFGIAKEKAEENKKFKEDNNEA